MSVRAAREFLALRNDSHCHEDQIALVLQDVSGGSSYAYGDGKPPDYRVKTVRASIRALTRGYAHYAYVVKGYEEASKTWRPLYTSDKSGGRTVSFDVAAFKKEFADQVHVLPEGDESGGAEWTCAAKAWGSWSSQASREATQAAKAGGAAPAGKGDSEEKSNAPREWWEAVKRDPVVMEVVGERLRAMKSAQDLTAEDRAALGSRVEAASWNNLILLPQEAQPEGVKIDFDRANKPPMFDFSRCATCIDGASWLVTHGGPQLSCMNRQAYLDKQSVGMQAWCAWKDAQVEVDRESDLHAIGRLSHLDPRDAEGLVSALWMFLREAEPVKPLSSYQGFGWDERNRHNYWPAGAENFAALTGLELPDLTGSHQGTTKWAKAAQAFLTNPPEGLDWPLALACVLVWQARVCLGLGEDIWATVAAATVVSL